jgi:hypothetical protein
MTEAEAVDQDDLAVGIRDHLAHQVLASDAEMHHALAKELGDLGCGEEGDLDAAEARDRAAIVACAAWLGQLKPGAREEARGVLLESSFRRHRNHKGRAHAAPPRAASRSIQAAKPTAGIGLALPSLVSRPS